MYQLPDEDLLMECYKTYEPRKGPLALLEDEIENFIQEKLSLSMWVYITMGCGSPERIKFEVFERDRKKKTGYKIYSYEQVKDPELFLMYIARDFLFS
jgi:hypothetical protein